ncbi:MAG: NADH-quinone oxidoreductase subunit M [Bdellovibrionales bacterium]|nr:NADH-quinone oxidoreductase subunit M [Bdellovibrionales bacterium]
MILLPLLGVAGQILFGKPRGVKAKDSALHRLVAIGTSIFAGIIGVVLVVRLYAQVGAGGAAGISEHLDWVGAFAISYAVRIDGLNALLVLLISVVFPVLLVSEWGRERGARGLNGLFLCLQSSLYGIVCAQDLFLLFFFWTLSALPIYFLVSIWGGEERERAGFRYMMTASVGNALLFCAIMVVYYAVDPNTFLLDQLSDGRLSGIRFGFLGGSVPVASLAFTLLCLSMVLRVPVWPLHGWFSYLMTQAPPSVSVALCGGFIPAAIYLFVRLSYGLFPFSLSDLSPALVAIGAFNVVIGAVGAVAQRDFRMFVASLCVTHTGLILVGVSSLDAVGVVGAVFQLFAFGLGVSGLMLFFGILRDRAKSSGFNLDGPEAGYGGVASEAPVMAVVTALIVASLLGFPGFGGFIGNALIFMGGYSVHPGAVLILGIGSLLLTLATFSVYMRIFLGKYPEGAKSTGDLVIRERGFLLPLVFLLVLLGVYPKPLLDMVRPSVEALLQLIH